MAAGDIHLTRFHAHLESEYAWVEEALLETEPNLGEQDIRTRKLLAFSLERIAGCPRPKVMQHITDGQNDRGIDAFYFDRLQLKAYIFQSKYVDSPQNSPLSEADAKSLAVGANEIFQLSIFKNGNQKLNRIKEEVIEAISLTGVELHPVLVSTSDKNVPSGAAQILEDSFATSLGDPHALKYIRLSDLYQYISPYGGGAGTTFNLTLCDYNMVAKPFNGYYGWVSGSELAKLYNDQGVKRLFRF